MPRNWLAFASLLALFTAAPVAVAEAEALEDSVLPPAQVALDRSRQVETRLDALRAQIDDASPGDQALPVTDVFRLIRLGLMAERWGPERFDPPQDRHDRVDQLAGRLHKLRTTDPSRLPSGVLQLLLPAGAAAGSAIKPALEIRLDADLLPGAELIIPRNAWPDPDWVQVRVGTKPAESGVRGNVMQEQDASVHRSDAIPSQATPDAAASDASAVESSLVESAGLEALMPARDVSAPRFIVSRTFLGWRARLESGRVPAGSPLRLEGSAVKLPLAETVHPEVWLRPDPADPALLLGTEAATLAVPEGRRVLVDSPPLLDTGESARVGVRVVDALGRPLPESEWPRLDVLVNGAFRERLDDKTELGVVFAQPGIYRLELRSGGGGTRGISEPIVVRSRPDFDVLWLPPSEHLTAATPDIPAADVVRHVINERSIEQGGAVARLMHVSSANSLTEHLPLAAVALAAPAFDERGTRMPRYLQPLQGGGAHLWYAARVAGAGYRFGFLQATAPSLSGNAHTAFVVPRGQTDWNATTSTYVTTRGKPFVDVRINGQLPGARSRFSNAVVVTGEVAASTPVHAVTIVKNGRPVHTIRPQDPVALGGATILELTLESPNGPWLDQRDWPRNGREWIGFVKVSGARIDTIHLDGAGSPRHAARLDADAGRVDFLTWSHGVAARLLMTLDRIDEGVTVELAIREGFEDDTFSPRYRQPSPTAGGRYLLGFDEISAGVRRPLRSEGYSDTVALQVRSQAAPLEATFRWEDTSRAQAGDFYWVNILLADGTRIWTTPVWNGDFDAPRAGADGGAPMPGTDN